jgi:hypothetical protein
VGHVAAASRKSPPVFCRRRGILTACFRFQLFAAPEGAFPNLLFRGANEKEESQTAQAPAIGAARSTRGSREAARADERKESRPCVTAVAPDALLRHRGRPEFRCFQRIVHAAHRQTPAARSGPVHSGRQFTKPLEVSAVGPFSAPALLMVSCYSYPVPWRETKSGKLAPLLRAMVEVGFIIFLFYSNLLMGEFTQTNGQGKSLAFAVRDIFTVTNFGIAIFSGLIGYVVFEFLRKRL